MYTVQLILSFVLLLSSLFFYTSQSRRLCANLDRLLSLSNQSKIKFIKGEGPKWPLTLSVMDGFLLKKFGSGTAADFGTINHKLDFFCCEGTFAVEHNIPLLWDMGKPVDIPIG